MKQTFTEHAGDTAHGIGNFTIDSDGKVWKKIFHICDVMELEPPRERRPKRAKHWYEGWFRGCENEPG